MFVCFIRGQMIRNRENHFARNSRTDDTDHLRIVYRHRFDPPNGLTISRKRREHHPSLSNSRRGARARPSVQRDRFHNDNVSILQQHSVKGASFRKNRFRQHGMYSLRAVHDLRDD